MKVNIKKLEAIGMCLILAGVGWEVFISQTTVMGSLYSDLYHIKDQNLTIFGAIYDLHVSGDISGHRHDRIYEAYRSGENVRRQAGFLSEIQFLIFGAGSILLIGAKFIEAHREQELNKNR